MRRLFLDGVRVGKAEFLRQEFCVCLHYGYGAFAGDGAFYPAYDYLFQDALDEHLISVVGPDVVWRRYDEYFPRSSVYERDS